MDVDRGTFIALASVLLGFGVLMVHSASITSRPTEFEQVYLSRHLVFLAIAVAVGFVCACMPASAWIRLAPGFLLATIVLLVLVLIPGIGTRVNGAQRWLRYGPLSLQPSELAKIALPLAVCRWLVNSRERHKMGFLRGFVALVPIVCVAGLVFVEPDLGTALFLAGGGALALFIGGWPLRSFAVTLALAVPALGCLVTLRPYQLRRLTSFIATWTEGAEVPYQIKQSLLSMGAGGLFGSGLGKGWQKLSYLPEANTDFVFAVAGEELGLLGTVTLVAVWVGLFVAGIRLLNRLPRSSFGYIAGFSLLAQLVLQAALNVAVVTGMAPSKGIAHPLMSYGGSNLVVSLASLGILISLAGPPRTAAEFGALDDEPEIDAVRSVADDVDESNALDAA